MSCRHGNHYDGCDICDEVDAAFEAGRRSALAEQPAQQEPVGYVCFEGDEVVWTGDPPESGTLLYTTPQAQPAREPLTDEQIDKAAMKLAECMDYPWAQMPEQGKRSMRSHAKAVIDASGITKGNT